MDLTALTDAIVTELETLDLPKHRVWRYVEPPVIRPDLGPMIAVYPTITHYDVMTTSSQYDQTDTLAVVWYAPTLDSVETGGTGSQPAAKAALEIAETILEKLRTFTVELPGVPGQEEGTVTRAEFQMLPGGYWVAEMFLSVTRWV